MKNLLLKALPHAVAVIIFAILASVYFSPVWDGYNLRQGDINEHIGMSKEIADYRMLHNEEPLWTDAMFGGMPAYQISVIHENNWLRHVDQLLKLNLPGPVGILFMAMLGFYILGLCLKVNPWLGILGGIGFGFATINILYLGAGHVSKVNAIAYMAPALGGLILATRGKWIAGSAVFALFFSLNIAANHLQMTYYLAILLTGTAIAEGIRLLLEKQFVYLAKTAGMLVVAAGIAVLPNMSNLLTTYEYSQYTTRGKSELTIEPGGAAKDESEKKGLETGYILEYNFGKGEAWSLLLPNAKGGQSGAIGNDKELLTSVPRQYREAVGQSNRYWGEQRYTGGAFYFGAIIMFLFILGLIFLKDAIKWPFLILTLVAIGLASKDPGGLNDFFINSFPMYNKFRDSKMILVVIQVMAPALGILFLDRLIKTEHLFGNRKYWLIGTGAVTLLAVLLLAAPSMTGSFVAPEMAEINNAYQEIESTLDPGSAEYQGAMKNIQDYESLVLPEIENVRREIYKADAGRTLLLFLCAGAIVVIAMFRKIPAIAAVAVLSILVAVDQMTVCARYLNTEKVKGSYVSYVKVSDKVLPHTADVADRFILDNEKDMVRDFPDKAGALNTAYHASARFSEVRDKNKLKEVAEFGALQLSSSYRVLALGNPFNEARTSYFHKSLGGYHGAKLKRYQEMIEFHIQPEMMTLVDSLQTFRNPSLLASFGVLNMLNTKYIIYNPQAPPIENPYNNGPAWIADSLITVASADEEITKTGEIRTDRVAVVHQEFSSALKPIGTQDSTSNVVLTEYATKKLTYEVKASADAAVIFSEIYYPKGWKCKVDGNEAETFRANYILRGVCVPAGEHTIEWSFEPESFAKGSTYSLAGSILLMVLVLGALVTEMRKK